MENEKSELTLISKQWDEAMITNDTTEISKFISDDWILIGSGGITSREQFLTSVSSGSLTHHTMSSDEMQVRIYQDTGIVISKGTSAGAYQGHEFSLYEWSTSIFKKYEGRWLCVLTSLTAVKG